MKITTDSSVSATLYYPSATSKGTLTFTSEFINFRPTRVTTETPEVKIPYDKIFDAHVFKVWFLGFNFTIIDKDRNHYKFVTTRSASIIKFLFNKF